MTTAMCAVNGMMCESCMAAVLDNVHPLPGVTDVTMDLVTGGRSPLLVTSRTKLGADAAREAIQHVGFVLQPPKAREQWTPLRPQPASSTRGASPTSAARGCAASFTAHPTQYAKAPLS